MKEGSNIFCDRCPGFCGQELWFAEEIHKEASGFANPQFIFSHWETRQIWRM